jgi:hypothetical protein
MSEAPSDLSTASREALLAVIARQQQVVTVLEQRITSLEQRLGARLVSLIVTLREATRLPVRAIRRLLRQLYDLRLSVGANTAASDRVAARGPREALTIRDRIRGSPWVHADETAWCQNGVNGDAWTFCTPTDHYFLRRGGRKKSSMRSWVQTLPGCSAATFMPPTITTTA